MNNNLFAVYSHKSSDHKINEDSIVCLAENNVVGFCISDGISTSLNSHIASSTITSCFKILFSKIEPFFSSKNLNEWFVNFLNVVNNKLKRHATNSKELELAATINITIIINKNLYTISLGDSLTYLISNTICLVNPVPEDNTQFDNSNETEDSKEYLQHFYSVYTNILPKYEIKHKILSKNDIVIVCSDGLYKHVRFDSFNFTNNAIKDCKELTQIAIKNKSSDDISIGVYYV